MWTRCQPAVVALLELVANGAIGEVRPVQADLGMRREYEPGHRLFDLALGGGALLDLGIDVVSFAQMLLDAPQRLHATCSRFPAGADAEASLVPDHGEGRSAALPPRCGRHFPAKPRCSAPPAGSTSSRGSTTHRPL